MNGWSNHPDLIRRARRAGTRRTQNNPTHRKEIGMSDSQSNGTARYRGPRYANGDPVPVDELDMLAKAFGFHSARHMDEMCAAGDRRRAARANFGKLAS